MLKRMLGLSAPTGIGVILLEVVLIVVGVLLGLTGNDWLDARKDHERADQALRHIVDELERNLDQIEGILPYHRQVKDSLDVLQGRVFMESATIGIMDLISAVPQGFSVPLLEFKGWELASSTGAIAHMDYSVATYLSRLYGLQEFLQGKLDYIGENLYVARNDNPSDLTAITVSMAMLINDIVIHEETLLDGYQEVLDTLQTEE